MKTHNRLYEQICSFENLFFAYKKARKGKTKKDYVMNYEDFSKAFKAGKLMQNGLTHIS